MKIYAKLSAINFLENKVQLQTLVTLFFVPSARRTTVFCQQDLRKVKILQSDSEDKANSDDYQVSHFNRCLTDNSLM